MKTLSAELLAHYAGGATTLATLWKITRRDTTVFAFTDHDKAITYPETDGLRYRPSSVYDASANSTKAELNVDTMEADGLLDDDGITAEDMEHGLWDGAAVEIIEVNYRDLSMGHNTMRVGTLGELSRDGPRFKAELRGLMYPLQNNIGRIVTPACDADLGDVRCGVDLEALRELGVVTAVTSNRLITTNLGGADTYTYGVITWTFGANDGLSMEVKKHSATGVLELQLPMPNDIAEDDTFSITPGCDKKKETCKDRYSNVVNFRGFSFVPGQDQILKVGGQ